MQIKVKITTMHSLVGDFYVLLPPSLGLEWVGCGCSQL